MGNTQEGDYTVTLTVTDDDGGVGSDSLQVTVTEPTAVSLASVSSSNYLIACTKR